MDRDRLFPHYQWSSSVFQKDSFVA